MPPKSIHFCIFKKVIVSILDFILQLQGRIFNRGRLFPTSCCQYAAIPNWCKIPMTCSYCMLFSSKGILIGNAAHLLHVLPTRWECEFMESGREKPLKLYLVGYAGGARQMIWFRKRRESGFGLEGHIKNLRGLSQMSIHLSKWL